MVFLTLFYSKLNTVKSMILFRSRYPFWASITRRYRFSSNVTLPLLAVTDRYRPLPTVTDRYRYEGFFVVNLTVGKVK